MNGSIRRRFCERDYLKSIEMKNKNYITETEIDLMLDEMERDGTVFDDLTFIFTPFGTGWKTKIIDNNNGDKEVFIDDLSPIAFEFYRCQLVDLTKKKYGLIKSA